MEQFYSLLMLCFFFSEGFENDPYSVDLIIFGPNGICSQIYLVEGKDGSLFLNCNAYKICWKTSLIAHRTCVIASNRFTKSFQIYYLFIIKTYRLNCPVAHGYFSYRLWAVSYSYFLSHPQLLLHVWFHKTSKIALKRLGYHNVWEIKLNHGFFLFWQC